MNVSKLVPVVSLTRYASFPRCFAILYTPSPEPIASISLFVCPIIIMFCAACINSCIACDTILAFTLVRFSTSCVLPPKKKYFPFCFIIAWSPPRPKAMSITALADLYFSKLFSPSSDIAILNVVWILSNVFISFISSSISNLSSFIFSTYDCSNIHMYVSLSDFIAIPLYLFIQVYTFFSASEVIFSFSSSVALCINSS